jgi:uncharacterized membrane protein
MIEGVSLSNFIISSALAAMICLMMLYHYKRNNCDKEELLSSIVSVVMLDLCVGMTIVFVVIYGMLFVSMLILTMADFINSLGERFVENRIDKEIERKTVACAENKLKSKVLKDIGE